MIAPHRVALAALGALSLAAACNALFDIADGRYDPALADAAGSADGPGERDGGGVGGEDAEPPCDADKNVDRHNCGRCGHDCAGGDCVAAECSPIAIVSDGGRGVYVAANTSRVFWSTTDGFVRSALVDGTDRTTIYAGPNAVGALAVTESDVFFQTLDVRSHLTTFTCRVSGCSGAPEDVDLLSNGDYDVITAGATAYVAGTPGVSAYTAGGTQRTIAAGEPAQRLAANQDALFWSNGGDGGAIRASALVAAAPRTVLTDTGATAVASPIAADDEHVFWMDRSTRELRRALLDGGGRETFAPLGTFNIEHLVADGTHVYWGDGTDVLRCRAASPCVGGGASVGSRVSTPHGFGINAAYVFWIEESGAIYRVAR